MLLAVMERTLGCEGGKAAWKKINTGHGTARSGEQHATWIQDMQRFRNKHNSMLPE